MKLNTLAPTDALATWQTLRHRCYIRRLTETLRDTKQPWPRSPLIANMCCLLLTFVNRLTGRALFIGWISGPRHVAHWRRRDGVIFYCSTQRTLLLCRRAGDDILMISARCSMLAVARSVSAGDGRLGLLIPGVPLR